VIGPGHYHVPLRHRVLAPVVLPGREHPREDSRHEDAEDEEDERVREPQARGAHSVRQVRLTGRTREQAIASFIPLLIGPQAAVWASRAAASSEAPDAVAEPDRPWNSTATAHSTRWLERVDHNRKATKPRRRSKVRFRVRGVIAEGTSGGGALFNRAYPRPDGRCPGKG
jgi:hypothetical protein